MGELSALCLLRVKAPPGRSLTTSVTTAIKTNIYKLKEETGLDTKLFNWFKISGGLPQTPGKGMSFRRKFLIIKTAAFRFERLG